MSGLSLEWHGTGIQTLKKAAERLGSGKFPVVASRALNHSGAKGKTASGRALVKQTGLKRKVVVAAMRVTKANRSTLQYRIDARGGDIALKYFDARETRKGVSAKPFNKRRVFEGTFIKGGRFPNRVALGMGGHVFARVGSGRFPIEKRRSGVILPREMVRAESARAWQTTVAASMSARLTHELRRLAAPAFG